MARSDHELIVVFKKDVSDERTLEIINSFGVKYRKGMDSSKGKIYFYSTGEKYILTFATEEEKDKFSWKHHQFMLEIHQIYEPDWDKQKD